MFYNQPKPAKTKDSNDKYFIRTYIEAVGMQLGSGYSYKKILFSLMFEIMASALIIFISLRVYIMGNGFFDYADQYWGPTMSGAHLASLL